jgi:hypothetical protein
MHTDATDWGVTLKMATKADFTPEEWEQLQLSIVDVIAYMSIVDPGFWATFKEASAAATFVAKRGQSSPSPLIHDLAGDLKMRRDDEVRANPANVEDPTLDRIEDAVALLREKAPDELAAFRDLIRGVARAEAEASHGVKPVESSALDKIDEALGGDEAGAD